mgnify:CR=1 FL=1
MKINIEQLTILAKKLRIDTLTMITQAKSGHPGGSLSALDLILYLYSNELNHDPKNPKNPSRDRFILSKGHGVPALYSVLAHYGYFAKNDLSTFRQVDSLYQGHPANRLLDCIEASTGSLGQGLSVALGIAFAASIVQAKPSYRVYALLGDGELQEGQVWEALMCAAHYKTNNLVIIIDRNKGQIDGLVDDVMGIEPLMDKFISFGCHSMRIDGHNFSAIHNALEEAKTIQHKPVVIIADTIKGKGVSFLEKDTVSWHGKALSAEELQQAIKELQE